MRILISAIALVWAGVSLGGNLVAAPAKFMGTNLSTPVLLHVGHAQFLWLGYTEWILLAILVLCGLFVRTKAIALLAIPAVIFVVQQIVVMPLLNERTLLQIASEALEHSSLHLSFVLLECLKLVGLLVAGILCLKATSSESYAEREMRI